jgi:hypothetical protein
MGNTIKFGTCIGRYYTALGLVGRFDGMRKGDFVTVVSNNDFYIVVGCHGYQGVALYRVMTGGHPETFEIPEDEKILEKKKEIGPNSKWLYPWVGRVIPYSRCYSSFSEKGDGKMNWDEYVTWLTGVWNTKWKHVFEAEAEIRKK